MLSSIGVIGQILMIIWFHVWQDDVRDLMACRGWGSGTTR